MSDEEFTEVAKPYYDSVFGDTPYDGSKLTAILKARTVQLTDIPAMIKFFKELPDYDKELFVNKKSKTNLENSPEILKTVTERLEALSDWNAEAIKELLINLATELELKNGTVMWPSRIAASGQAVTPGGAVEILDILGKDETLRRLNVGLAKLS